VARIYLESLSGLDIRLPRISAGNVHTWHQFTIQVRRRDELKDHLRQHGVDSMIYYPVPLHFHKPYAHLAQGQGSLPETERACREVLSLPIHQYLTDEQVCYVADKVREFVEAKD
jgi:dTDP-4-amino-4,6-dideoxygalactose transaminase